MKTKTILAPLVLLLTSILIAQGYYSQAVEDDGSQDTNRDPSFLRELFKRHQVYRGWTTRRTRRSRYRRPWKIGTAKPSLPFVRPTTKVTVPSTTSPEICLNHTKVSRVQDELGATVCLRRTKQELLVQLESVGGFIKRYTAINETDACGFEELTTLSREAEAKSSELTTKPTKTPEVKTPASTKRLIHSGDQRRSDQAEYDFKLQRMKRSFPTSPGTRIRGCQGRGTIPDGSNLHRLCTECAATTRLGDDRFPNFINEVICRDKDRQCAAKMGICLQRTLQLSFLRFSGRFELDRQLSTLTGKTVYSEVWEQYTQEIRSCCECQMYPYIYHEIASRDDGDDGDDSDEDDDIQS
ncbi:uncharacterized protein LOC110042621 [Orbicella faveolata]|uniref:uncharacterized protein LOC110042621 n=1 Tax=Orbicella faveolata TaxID=48498 RepID=UPI0009E490FE|nr:uncharacterized protein LOC110042621 [Orbicella faveolata]